MNQRGDADSLVVPLGARSYRIHLCDGQVSNPAGHADFWRDCLATFDASRDIALVTNETIAPLYGTTLSDHWASTGMRVCSIVVPDGERFKNAEMLSTIHDAMLDARFDRRVVVVALGGGVVGDVAGFAAATYQRGVRFVQIPTTLLAQVDSSVGGKTGINHRLGKNMIGAFHQPRAVVVDLSTLDTLPAREFASGIAEIVKYGASLDASFFAWLERSMPRLLQRDRATLAYAIRRSCELKATIVAADEEEGGKRALLNFGHTFGHAIEGASGYGTWLHGEAVAAGMVMAAQLSVVLGSLDPVASSRIANLLIAAGLPVDPPRLSRDQWRQWMSSDKKADGGRLRFVVMDGLGRSSLRVVDDVALDAVLKRADDASSPMAASG